MRQRNRLIPAVLWLSLLYGHGAKEANAQTTNSWSVPVRIQIGAFDLPLRFGVHPNATVGFNAGIDTLAPPPAFTPYAVFSIPVFPNSLQADFRAPASAITWNLVILNSAQQKIRVSWNTSQFPASAALALNDTLNMLVKNSAEFTGDRTLAIKYASTVPVTSTPVSKAPETFSLRSYPNPFVTTTTIELSLPIFAPVAVRIFNVLGQEVRAFKHAPITPGRLAIEWDGKDAKGTPVPTGLYLCRLEAAGRVVLGKLYRVR
jgi:hypothetical protein